MRFAAWIGVVGLSGLAACSNGDNLAPSAQSGDEGVLLAVSPIGEVRSTFRVFKGTGDITATVAEFRDALGQPPNGATPGPLTSGRREINWDGVPPDFDNNNSFPGDFFRKVGALIASHGTGLRNSSNDFFDLNPAYAEQFEPFSKPKTFASTGSPSMDLTFVVPGSDTPAAVNGVGIVFCDVDRVGSASIKLFDAKGRSLGLYLAPVRSDATGLSFVGVVFDATVIARATITAGQAAVDAGLQDLSDGGNRDLVVTDNFLFGEPQALP
jgi:hypothetical protein